MDVMLKPRSPRGQTILNQWGTIFRKVEEANGKVLLVALQEQDKIYKPNWKQTVKDCKSAMWLHKTNDPNIEYYLEI